MQQMPDSAAEMAGAPLVAVVAAPDSPDAGSALGNSTSSEQSQFAAPENASVETFTLEQSPTTQTLDLDDIEAILPEDGRETIIRKHKHIHHRLAVQAARHVHLGEVQFGKMSRRHSRSFSDRRDAQGKHQASPQETAPPVAIVAPESVAEAVAVEHKVVGEAPEAKALEPAEHPASLPHGKSRELDEALADLENLAASTVRVPIPHGALATGHASLEQSTNSAVSFGGTAPGGASLGESAPRRLPKLRPRTPRSQKTGPKALLAKAAAVAPPKPSGLPAKDRAARPPVAPQRFPRPPPPPAELPAAPALETPQPRGMPRGRNEACAPKPLAQATLSSSIPRLTAKEQPPANYHQTLRRMQQNIGYTQQLLEKDAVAPPRKEAPRPTNGLSDEMAAKFRSEAVTAVKFHFQKRLENEQRANAELRLTVKSLMGQIRDLQKSINSQRTDAAYVQRTLAELYELREKNQVLEERNAELQQRLVIPKAAHAHAAAISEPLAPTAVFASATCKPVVVDMGKPSLVRTRASVLPPLPRPG